MGSYQYLTKTKILETNDPSFEGEKILWILGKMKDRAMEIVREKGDRYFLSVSILEYVKLPRPMIDKDAWAYLDELLKKEKQAT